MAAVKRVNSSPRSYVQLFLGHEIKKPVIAGPEGEVISAALNAESGPILKVRDILDRDIGNEIKHIGTYILVACVRID